MEIKITYANGGATWEGDSEEFLATFDHDLGPGWPPSVERRSFSRGLALLEVGQTMNVHTYNGSTFTLAANDSKTTEQFTIERTA